MYKDVSLILNNKAAEFLNKVLSDEKLKPQLANKTPAQAVELAAEQGYDVTAEDLKKAAESFRKETAETNGAAAEKIRELNVDEMDKVAGGYFFHPQVCSSNFDDGETCWFNDYCGQMWNLYSLRDDNASARCTRTVKSTDWHSYDE